MKTGQSLLGLTCPPVPPINDPNHRVAGDLHLLPHFETGMYGWVTVRDN